MKTKKRYLSLDEGVAEFKRLIDKCDSVQDMLKVLNSPSTDYDGPGDRVFSWGGFYLQIGKLPFGRDESVWPAIHKVCHDFFDRVNKRASEENQTSNKT